MNPEHKIAIAIALYCCTAGGHGGNDGHSLDEILSNPEHPFWARLKEIMDSLDTIGFPDFLIG